MATVRRTFRSELRDFLCFVWRPRLGPRWPARRQGNGWWVDWRVLPGAKRLIQWAVILWLFNAFLFGPLAAMAAGAGGAEHRLDLDRIPWLHALIWAPLVEELVFRYGLRRPAQLLWFWPVAVFCLFFGPVWYSQVALALALAFMFYGPAAKGKYMRFPRGTVWHWRAWLLGFAWPWSWRKRYIRFFGWVFYGATLLFAALHLYNFNLQQVPVSIWPFLVIPQCFTGLALGWLRVRYGIGASIALHALFNAGPLLIIFIVVSLI